MISDCGFTPARFCVAIGLKPVHREFVIALEFGFERFPSGHLYYLSLSVSSLKL